MRAGSVEGAVTAPRAVDFAPQDCWLADHIPGARLRERPGANHLWWLPEPSRVVDLVTFTGKHSR